VSANKDIEAGLQFLPQFGPDGLITAVVQDAKTSQVLMVAYMNREALEKTIETGKGTYYSRSRKKLWTKGEQSGHFQKVEQILIDCDQDCILLKVTVQAGQCHLGYQSCFHRVLKKDSKDQLERIAEKVFDPDDVYRK
jgi:phosphoribosyl-AMP cyclohydrolase